ncbi:hypothetical protein SeMB42_g06306 [Synchytrium endobioticum]|nr:hypothetical protein SeMB42_g06306 [Synchytrium endobioticum]
MSIRDRKGGSWSSFGAALGLTDLEANTVDNDGYSSPESSQNDSNPYGLAIGDEVPVVTCNACSRPVLQTSLLAHLEICPGVEAHLSKKIMSEHGTLEHELPAPMTPSDPFKPEKSKGKGINLDERCGVTVDGLTCTRAITCKKHSVVAKRGVHGRSKPYDVLALRFQNSHQFKATSAGKVKTAPSKVQRPTNAIPDMVTSEDETQYIFDAIRYHTPQPIATSNYFKLRR